LVFVLICVNCSTQDETDSRDAKAVVERAIQVHGGIEDLESQYREEEPRYRSINDPLDPAKLGRTSLFLSIPEQLGITKRKA